MEWSELDALADELRRELARGALRTLPPDAADHAGRLPPATFARITLADIAYVREWHRLHPWDSPSSSRLENLADDVRRLLALVTSGP